MCLHSFGKQTSQICKNTQVILSELLWPLRMWQPVLNHAGIPWAPTDILTKPWMSMGIMTCDFHKGRKGSEVPRSSFFPGVGFLRSNLFASALTEFCTGVKPVMASITWVKQVRKPAGCPWAFLPSKINGDPFISHPSTPHSMTSGRICTYRQARE